MDSAANLSTSQITASPARNTTGFATQPSDARAVGLALLLGGLPTAAGVAWYVVFRSHGSSGGIWLEVFLGNWFSPLMMWVFIGALIYLMAKGRMIRREVRTFALLDDTFLKGNLEAFSNREAPADFFAHLQSSLEVLMPDAAGNALLLQRIRQWLNHAGEEDASERRLKEVGERLGEADGVKMNATYMLPRFCIWLLPILGFMGTVWGISQAVGGFAFAMGNQVSAEGLTTVLQEQLPLVTTNLGTAFNTTLQALLLSVPLMLFLQHLERCENQHLSAVNECWTLRYLPRLQAFFAPAVAAAPATTATTTSSPGGNGAAPPPLDTAAELQTLSSQIMGLRAIMTDLHETVYLDALQRTTRPTAET